MPASFADILKFKNSVEYAWFLKEILPHVIGISKWKKVCTIAPVSEISTLTDEAFGLVALDNAWDLWSHQAIASNVATVAPAPKAKYTRGGNMKGNKCSGWTDAGIQQFNRFRMAVSDDRKKPHRKQVEADIMRDLRMLVTGKQGTIQGTAEVAAINDLGGEAATGHPLLQDDSVGRSWRV